jgi:hypothetical protein
MAKGQGKTRRAYMLQLAAERLTGEKQETYTNGDMERGKELEQEAREYYEELNSCIVQQIGFAKLNDDTGASPDGLIDNDGTIEIKCPKTTTHLDTILSDSIDTRYIPQIQGQLWVLDRKWCDFISYDPRVKDMPIFIKRVYRDETYISNLKSEVEIFAEQLKDMVEQFTKPVI